MFSLDELDKKVLNALIGDSRMSYRQIAKDAKSSVVTVMNRVKRLEQNNIITRYTIGVSYAKIGYEFQVIAEVRVRKGQEAIVGTWLRKHPHITTVLDHTGPRDMTAIAKFKNRKELNKFIKEVQTLDAVERTESKLLLQTIKEQPIFLK